MVRLRYKHPPDDMTKLYTNLVVINSNLIIIGMLDCVDFQYVVMNADGTELCSGEADTMREAKLLIRKDFEKLGVVFDGEVRRRDSLGSNRSA